MKTLLILAVVVLLSSCAGFVSKAPPVDDTSVSDVGKEAGIIEELNISGCDIKKFVTAESSRQNIISVTCK